MASNRSINRRNTTSVTSYLKTLNWEVLLGVLVFAYSVHKDNKDDIDSIKRDSTSLAEIKRISKRDSAQIGLLAKAYDQSLRNYEENKAETARIRSRDSIQILLLKEDYLNSLNENKRLARKDSIQNSILASNAEVQKKFSRASLDIHLSVEAVYSGTSIITAPVFEITNSGNASAENITIKYILLTVDKRGTKEIVNEMLHDFGTSKIINVGAKEKIKSTYGMGIPPVRLNFTSYIAFEISYTDKYDHDPIKVSGAKEISIIENGYNQPLSSYVFSIKRNEEELIKGALVKAGFNYEKIKASIHQQLSQSGNESNF